MKTPDQFILIDDDPLNLKLCKFLIKQVMPQMEVIHFTAPENGLNFLNKLYEDKEKQSRSVLLVNINMPGMDGWGFLDRYALLDELIRKQVTVYILTASLYWYDQERALKNEHVKKYLVKPLTVNMINDILLDLKQIN